MDLFSSGLILLSVLDTIKDKFLGISDTLSLFWLGLKLVVLLFIVSYVRGHFGASPIVTVLTFILGYIIIFQNWMIFGPLMIFYLLVVFGFTAIFMDLAIVKPWKHTPEMGEATDTHSFKTLHEGRR